MARTPQPECRPRRQPSPLRQPLTASTQTVTRPDSAPCVVSQLETSTLTGGVWIRNWVGGPWCDRGTGVSVCGGGAEIARMWSQWRLVSPPLAGTWIP